MKTFHAALVILCPLCHSIGQTFDTVPALPKEDSAFIKGQIILRDKKPSSITFYVVDYLVGIEKPERASVDVEGRFQIRFFIRNTHQVSWRYDERGSYGSLILSPGDSLTLIVTDDQVQFFGTNAAASEDHYHLRTQKEWSAYYYALDTGYRLEPERYLQFRKERYQQDLDFLQSYCKTRDCTALFNRWYTTDAKVRYYQDLMAYSWKSVDYGLGSPVRLTREQNEKYNAAYLEEIDLDDSTFAISKWYTFFLNGYSQKVEKRIPFDQVENVLYITKLNFLLEIISREASLEVSESSSDKRVLENLLKKAYNHSAPDSADVKVMWKLSERYEVPLQRAMDTWNADRWVEQINAIPHQKTRELRFLHTFVRSINQMPNLDYVYEKMIPNIKNPTYRELFTRAYKSKKEEDALIGNPQGIRVIPEKYGESANRLLSNIVKANRNKVIIIDFWGTWCAPCLSDFTGMKAFKGKLPADSVSFVYLCSRSSRDLWVKQIKQYSVTGQHYFLSDTQYSEFQEKFGLNAFPAYIIVDAKKRIYKNISLRDMRDEKLFMEKVQGIMKRDN
jgi:thiol-disulfide isomerase/thioredoxin